MAEYSANSHKSKETEKRAEKVVTGAVKIRKKNEIRKFADVFVPEDVANVRSHILVEVIVPLIKKAISETVDTLLWGESGRSNKKRSPASRVSYGSYYERDSDRRDYSSPRQRMNTYDFDEVIIPSRGEAEDVLIQMRAILTEYERVRVADFYETVGITGDFTANNYGWINLDAAKVVRVSDGYMIKFPRAIALD